MGLGVPGDGGFVYAVGGAAVLRGGWWGDGSGGWIGSGTGFGDGYLSMNFEVDWPFEGGPAKARDIPIHQRGF